MGEGGEDGEATNYDEAVEGVEEAENPEETADLEFEELMASIQEDREERKEQVGYDWCSTIRDAGELYRETKSVSDVGEELDLSEAHTDEALTVYRLIFEAPADVAMKASRPGRAYFSLENNAKEVIDQDEDEPLEDLVREYVGGVYLEHNVTQESVGEPTEDTTPSLSISEEKMRESLSDVLSASQYPALGMRMNMAEMIPDVSDMISTEQFIAPALAGVSNQLPPLQEMRNSPIANSLPNLPGLSHQINHTIAHQLQPTLPALDTFRSSALTDLAAELNGFRTIANSVALGAFADLADDLQIPTSVAADFSTLGISAAPASVNQSPIGDIRNPATTQTPSTGGTSSSESIVTKDSLSSESIKVDDSSTSHSNFATTEVVVETSIAYLQEIFSTGPAWDWFIQLPRQYQYTIVHLVVLNIAFELKASPRTIGALGAIAPALWKFLLDHRE